MVSRYTDERLAALWSRVESLEQALQDVAIILQDGKNGHRLAAFEKLQEAVMESFGGALLCNRGTTDEMLDAWLPEIEKHDAQLVAAQQPAQPVAEEPAP